MSEHDDIIAAALADIEAFSIEIAEAHELPVGWDNDKVLPNLRALLAKREKPAVSGAVEEALDTCIYKYRRLCKTPLGNPRYKARHAEWQESRTALLAAVAAEREEARAEERERCAQIADDHECGDRDDIICQHQNCGMLVAAAIREGGERG